ncbi:MAG: GMC family oxidoreductase N-terminal domain-containing protein, partial [Acidobacteriaceae bacterium]|nr:GMC family oxidoreductase N-terminal domain-containing protein [Acidobacteriaceae bacterium]
RSKQARPGTHLITGDETELERSGMPAASMSTNVGGMGAHWTCACPRPGNTETVDFISTEDLTLAFTKAEELLCVSTEVFRDSAESEAIHRTLSDLFDSALPGHRKVQRMPLACRPCMDGDPIWTGADTILGPLAEPNTNDRYRLRSQTICRRLITRGDRVTGAVIEHLPTGSREEIQADLVIVAADALRTPQLLWASGIRPPALGHYLNDHLWTFSAVALHPHLVSSSSGSRYRSPDNTIGIFQVPFHAPTHPYHGQVMHMDVSPVPLDGGKAPDAKHVVGMGWSCQKQIRFEDCVQFSETERDYFGMPKMHIEYEVTPSDQHDIAEAAKEQARAGAALGTPVFSDAPLLVPPGTSLHYQGSVRMGATNDEHSVCDSHSRVWGFNNLYVGGNGVIPMATACNPTLTSVALAVHACREIEESF